MAPEALDFIGNSTRHVIASGFCEAISRLMGQIDLLEIASPRKERGVRNDIVIADNVYCWLKPYRACTGQRLVLKILISCQIGSKYLEVGIDIRIIILAHRP